MNRVLAAARLHLIHPLVILGVPWLVVGIAFAINWALWSTAGLDEASGGDAFTGGVLSLYITVMVAFVQTVTQLLPFAMGISLSRRTFYLGTALVALVQALVYGIVLALLTQVEEATGGWGAGLEFWAPAAMNVDNFALQVLLSGAPMLALIFVGMGLGVLYKRWGQVAVWGLIIGSLVLFGGLAILVTGLDAWAAIGGWFADRSLTTLVAGLPLLLTVVVAGLTWLGLRRVVP
ncbi:hypothetical protein [Blastococcus tunisiensis]|uniref:ABC-2 type transport system permease protein n=1 Tax=Blastococcus tunisiensis TaxID=1798228 RepID=A0A1I2MLR5_9ACTN|nr:hypothetical protein [Blastococcus sp. DSM 46838]SFF91639.1 hypothetical protein SAMN05216574_1333 [Blastococcus sp. DSM 46838]